MRRLSAEMISVKSKLKIVVAGGSGYLGRCLAETLHGAGYEVVILSRKKPQLNFEFTFAPWDGFSLGSWAKHLDGAVAIVNLAGRSVDCIKTAENKDAILRSRVDSTTILGKALETCANLPSVWVQMSTAHIYGDSAERICSEQDTFGYGLAPFVGKAWEEAFQEAVPKSMRQVILRTSFVIGKSAGALPALARLTRFGLGGKIGHGKQGMSWIHEKDMMKIFMESIENPTIQGAYIASAPNPVSNAEFMKCLRTTLKVPVGLPAPAWLVNLGAPLIAKTDPELALCGRYVIPQRLEQENFTFQFRDLKSALADIFTKRSL